MTLASAAIISDNKVINIIAVDINSDREIKGWAPAEGQKAFVLPDGSPVGINWDYMDDQFYSPIPTKIIVYANGHYDLPYGLSGDLPDGVTFSDGRLSASVDATLGDFTVTLNDSPTNRSVECKVTILEAIPPST
ncbi:MAG TPA: hypothetical protein V6C72_02720 [Chroococcales cyanobacterium]|jgi:hypothetical protein